MKYNNIEVSNSIVSVLDREKDRGDVIFNSGGLVLGPGAFSGGTKTRTKDDPIYNLPDRARYYIHNGDSTIKISVIDSTNYLTYARSRGTRLVEKEFGNAIVELALKTYPDLEECITKGRKCSRQEIINHAQIGLYIVDYQTVHMSTLNRLNRDWNITNFMEIWRSHGGLEHISPLNRYEIDDLMCEAIANGKDYVTIRTISFIPYEIIHKSGPTYYPNLDLVIFESEDPRYITHPRTAAGAAANVTQPETNSVVIRINDLTTNNTGYWLRIGNVTEKVVHSRDHSRPEGASLTMVTADGSRILKEVDNLKDLPSMGIYPTEELANNDGVHPDEAELIEKKAKARKQMLEYIHQEREAELSAMKHNHAKERMEMERALTMLKNEIETENILTDLATSRLANYKKLLEFNISKDKILTDMNFVRTKLGYELEVLKEKKDLETFKVGSEALTKILSIGNKVVGLL